MKLQSIKALLPTQMELLYNFRVTTAKKILGTTQTVVIKLITYLNVEKRQVDLFNMNSIPILIKEKIWIHQLIQFTEKEYN